MELIALFKKMLGLQIKSLMDNRERYENGLLKLQSTADQVDGLQEQLSVK